MRNLAVMVEMGALRSAALGRRSKDRGKEMPPKEAALQLLALSIKFDGVHIRQMRNRSRHKLYVLIA